jgi:hypothetical protein
VTDVWELITADTDMEKAGVPRKERERLVAGMAKVKPVEASGSAEKKPWEHDDYIVQLIPAKDKDGNLLAPVKKPNKFFMSEAMLCEKYGNPVPGERYWLDEKGEKRYPDWPEDEQNYTLIFEVIDGPKKGDWLWVNFVSPRIYRKKDGTWGGKLAAMYLAADPTFNLEEGYEDDFSDLMRKPLRAVVEPKDDPQYAKVTAWMPVKPADMERIMAERDKALPVSGDMSPEDIPF